MKKVIISLLMVCLLINAVFASSSTEDTKSWFNANKIADSSNEYVATNRNATLSLANGEVFEASGEYLVVGTSMLNRDITGSKEVFKLLDTLSDGYVLTPFEDDIVILDKTYLGLETVNGVSCHVFDCDIAVFESIFFYGKTQGGELLGEDEGSTDKSVNIKLYIDSNTNNIVKEVITYEDLPFLTDLSIKQEVTFLTTNGINVPENIITTGHFRVRGSKNFSVYDIYDFKIEETQSNFVYMKDYDHEWLTQSSLEKLKAVFYYCLMNTFTDTHFHLLSIKEKGIDIDQLDIYYGMDIGTDVHDINLRLPLIKKFNNIKYTIGAGPWVLKDELNIDYIIKEIEKDIKSNNPSMVGEIGLDYFHEYNSHEKQFELFERQLLLSNSLNLPVVIHNRDANEDTIKILSDVKVEKGGIIHCFSATKDFLFKALDLNYYISFSGTVTYKKNDYLRDMAKLVPIDKLLLETDSPYLSPVPDRGKINNPERIIHTYKCVAQLRTMEIDELKEVVRNNFDTLLSRWNIVNSFLFTTFTFN